MNIENKVFSEKEFETIVFAFIIPLFSIFFYIGWFMLANARFSYLAYKNKWVDRTLKSKLSFDKVSITIGALLMSAYVMFF